MEEALKQRIRRLLEERGSSVYQLAKAYNLNQKTLNNQINSETQISASTILHVIEAFPDVSSEWLLLGQGPMYKSENTTQAPSQAEENISGKAALNVLIKTIEYYQKEIERLVENIDELTRENEIMKTELERKKAAGE